MTSPGHFIVAGVQSDEGVLISRDPDGVARKVVLGEGDSDWYLVMTNLDAWRVEDPRYNKAVSLMNELG